MMRHFRGMGAQESAQSSGKDASGAGSQKSTVPMRQPSTGPGVLDAFQSIYGTPRQPAPGLQVPAEDNTLTVLAVVGGVGLVLIAGIAIMAVGKKKPVSANKRRRTRR